MGESGEAGGFDLADVPVAESVASSPPMTGGSLVSVRGSFRALSFSVATVPYRIPCLVLFFCSDTNISRICTVHASVMGLHGAIGSIHQSTVVRGSNGCRVKGVVSACAMPQACDSCVSSRGGNSRFKLREGIGGGRGGQEQIEEKILHGASPGPPGRRSRGRGIRKKEKARRERAGMRGKVGRREALILNRGRLFP
nr:hypothetical protein CFP56_56478 [Quercus suber]